MENIENSRTLGAFARSFYLQAGLERVDHEERVARCVGGAFFASRRVPLGSST